VTVYTYQFSNDKLRQSGINIAVRHSFFNRSCCQHLVTRLVCFCIHLGSIMTFEMACSDMDTDEPENVKGSVQDHLCAWRPRRWCLQDSSLCDCFQSGDVVLDGRSPQSHVRLPVCFVIYMDIMMRFIICYPQEHHNDTWILIHGK
jgi:hypothetical protein